MTHIFALARLGFAFFLHGHGHGPRARYTPRHGHGSLTPHGTIVIWIVVHTSNKATRRAVGGATTALPAAAFNHAAVFSSVVIIAAHHPAVPCGSRAIGIAIIAIGIAITPGTATSTAPKLSYFTAISTHHTLQQLYLSSAIPNACRTSIYYGCLCLRMHSVDETLYRTTQNNFSNFKQ